MVVFDTTLLEFASSSTQCIFIPVESLAFRVGRSAEVCQAFSDLNQQSQGSSSGPLSA